MNQPKHTPGPWTHDPIWSNRVVMPDYSYIWIIGYDSKGGPIHVARVDGPREEQCTANARLIAAAPELLEALKLLLAECDQQVSIGNMPYDWVSFGIARAAIAKAEGAQP